MRGKKKFLFSFKAIVLTFYFLIVAFPIYWVVITSFKPSAEILDRSVITYFPHTFTTENYSTLFRMMDYGVYIKNSTIVALLTALVVTILSILSGYALSRYKFKGKGLILLFFLVIQVIPGILVLIPLYSFFAEAGLINTKFSLLVYYICGNLPFCSITMRSFFQRIPDSLEEAAMVDGCGKIQTIIKIVLPIMLPGIASVFVFGFLGGWNELIGATIFVSTAENWTIPVALKALIGKNNIEWGVLMAGGVIALLPTGILFAVMQKFVVEGITAGAVKE
ncbi:carbohydrate ABC transporter permease [Faecalicatena contorta]|uniref:ABC transporter permease subunit n=1 Tax=Faecalicatena contorta TaxID=39482 RepID=UPI00129DCCBD|nr:carbohydrate ABC transporter permease [Faecalicatena contorta]